MGMGITMLISLWITPYLISKIGLAAYGYVGVLNNLINFMAVITITLTSMVGRYLIVSFERKGPGEASKYISSAFYTNIFLGVLLIPLILLLSINLDRLLNIQETYVFDVKISFFLSGIAFILSSIYLVLSTGAYCKNRLEIQNGIIVSSNLVRLVVLISIFSIFNARIWHVAVASVMQVLIAIILAALSFKALLPDVQFKIKFFKLRNSIEILSSGFLISIIILGNNFLTQIDLLVGNRYLTAEIIGMYAAVLLLPNSIRNIASAISSAFTPTTISLYSSGNMDELRKYSNRVVKFCGLLVGWPVAIISGLAVPILKIWLGKDYSAYEFTIILMLLPLTVHLAVNQLFNVQQATNKVKIPAIASILLGGMNLFLAVFFTASLKMGIFGIVLSGVIMNTIRTIIFIPIYTAIVTNQPKYTYYKGILSPIFASLVVCAMGITIQRLLTINTLASILFSAFALSIVYVMIALMFLNQEEREIIKNQVFPIIRKLDVKTARS